jgi:hypothetical protein
VIVERLPKIPPPPQNIMVERWLGFDERVRRVVFQPAPKLIPAPPPKNVLIQWDSPDVALHRDFKFLGVLSANPDEYRAKYGASLVEESQLPALAVNHFKPPAGEVLGAHYRPKLPKLVGDLQALSLINLNVHGLGAYKQIIPAAPLAVEAAASVAAAEPAAPSTYATSTVLSGNYETTYGSGFASSF